MVISLKELYGRLKASLQDITDSPDFEAKELLRHLFGVTTVDILMDRRPDLPEEKLGELETLLQRRLSREPLQYIIGSWEFYGREFFVGEGVLIPRPDTEVLAEEVLNFLKGKENPKVLELCGGSGCLAATIALEHPGAEVTVVEKSPEAFAYLTKNCEALKSGVRCVLGDALDTGVVEGDFDCILSNPPYLSAQDMSELEPEVQKEPVMALYGEEDGLFFYRELTALWKNRLVPGGLLAYEIGMGQHDDVAEILRTNGLNNVCQTRDCGDIIRVLTGVRPADEM